MNQFGQCQALWQKDAVNKIMERFFTTSGKILDDTTVQHSWILFLGS